MGILSQSIKYALKKMDIPLLCMCLMATCFGIVLIASATVGPTGGDWGNVIVQSAAMIIGVGLYVTFSIIDIEHFAEKWWLFFAFDVVMILLLATPLGVGKYGNKSWLDIPGVPFMIQPSEIVKLPFTILLAKQMAWFRQNRRMRGLDSLFWPAAHTGFMVLLIYAVSSDAGSALVYLMIYIGMAFAAGLPWYWFATGFVGAGVGILGLVIFDKVPSHMMSRFIALFNHNYDPQGVNWQQNRGIMALGSGGLFGQGLFNGIQTQSTNDWALPERETDFIFCVAGEELGMVGCLAIILLEAVIIYRCFQTARVAKTTMGSYICVGLATMLMFQTIENIGMCLYIMPVIGLTLPFFSYGGSSIVTLLAAMGIISGVRSRTLPEWLRNS